MEKIIKNFSWVLLSNIIMAFSKWLVVLLLARVTAPEIVGIYTLGIAIVSPILLFANYKLRGLYVSDKNPKYKELMFVRVILDVFSILLIFIITYFIYPSYLIIVVLITLIKITDLHSELIYAVSHHLKNYSFYSKLIIIKYIFSIIIFAIGLLIFNSLKVALLLQLIFQFLYLIFEFYITFLRFKTKINFISFNIKSVRTYFIIGFPLGLTMFIVSFNASFPRYVLEEFFSIEVLGIFSTIAYLAVVGNLFITAITQNLLPKLREVVEKKEFNTLDKIIFRYCPIIVVLVSIIILPITYYFGDYLLLILYGNDYVGFSAVFSLITLSVIINGYSAIVDNILLTVRLVNFQYAISIILLILNISTALILVYQFEMVGAALTMVIINFLQLALRIGYYIYYRKKKEGLKYE